MKPDSDRRTAERRTFRTKAVAVINENQVFQVRTLNLSVRGIAVVSHRNIPIGTVISLRFIVPMKVGDSTSIQVQAIVVHSVFSNELDEFNIGLAFIDLSPTDAAAIGSFLA